MPIRTAAVVIGPGSSGLLRVQLGRLPGERVVDVRADCLPAQLRMPNASFVAEVEAGEVVGAAAAGPEWLFVQDEIRRVLNADWDPIGIADEVQDEYDFYIDGLYRLIQAGSAEEVIAEHLRTIEVVRMEYPGQPLDRLRRVAAKLRGLQLPTIDDSTA